MIIHALMQVDDRAYRGSTSHVGNIPQDFIAITMYQFRRRRGRDHEIIRPATVPCCRLRTGNVRFLMGERFSGARVAFCRQIWYKKHDKVCMEKR